MSESLTVAEAVPLVTVYIQRVLDDAEVRSVVIKGPAFSDMGVRRPKQSNDVDLLIEADGQARAHVALARAGWTVISPWVPRQLDDVVHSKTYWHPKFPVTADVHHAFSGLFSVNQAFDAIWARRHSVAVAHCAVTTPNVEHAVVVEALNRLKGTNRHGWPRVASEVVRDCHIALDVTRIRAAVNELGATESVHPLLVALGDTRGLGQPSPAFVRWSRDCGRHDRFMDVGLIFRRAPLSLPKFLWKQISLDQAQAKKWAIAHGVANEGRSHVLRVRVVQLARTVLRSLRRR